MLDIGLIESLARLNRFKSPEPITHAKAAGARGFFVPYMGMEEYTEACFLQNSDMETPVLVRFSLMMGRPGCADTIRDVRGFNVKFSTDSGVYDMVGTNLPVTFINKPEKLPALYEALSPCPKTNIRNPERLWNFVADNPEAMHMITWLYTNRGTIKSYRSMEGHSAHTYIWKNKEGKSFWVRYHWSPVDDTGGISRQEAEFLAGYDPDVATRDLSIALEEGRNISYELRVQIISTRQSVENEMSLLNPTVIWPESSVPPMKVGKLILNKNIENYREEVENCNFSPGRLIPGIQLSGEPMLMAMTFLSMDWEEYGYRNSGHNIGSAFSGAEGSAGSCGELSNDKALIGGQLAWRFRSMDEKEKDTLIENIGDELLFVDEKIQRTVIDHISDANKDVGTSLEKWLGL